MDRVDRNETLRQGRRVIAEASETRVIGREQRGLGLAESPLRILTTSRQAARVGDRQETFQKSGHVQGLYVIGLEHHVERECGLPGLCPQSDLGDRGIFSFVGDRKERRLLGSFGIGFEIGNHHRAGGRGAEGYDILPEGG